ncbi:Protein ICE2 [Wickerhamiella sorbophila]|uniref:Protein ICE2 n=1 Tax=Wickerhamiella sorbophila TaxID=45607 RepID=A0A2T0FGH9_9ASCO|nr:Protein ICE2 [Wickerhamiella sorbophila]PRT54084.1 Protein ICE2 [Wickerhamiella sorbophila]
MTVAEITRFLYGTLYQGVLLLSIPLAFDVGGEDCGISYTLLLIIWYASMATIRIVLRGTRLHTLGSAMYYLSILVLPSLLLLHMSFFPQLIENPLYQKVMYPWKMTLVYATGPFALLEGFCTIVTIQVISRLARNLARRSDVVSIWQLCIASLLISLDLFFLARIYTMPSVVGALTATLIGAAITVCISLSVYGIWTKKSNATETSLLFSYIVYVIYLTFTDFQASDAPLSLFPFGNQAKEGATQSNTLFSSAPTLAVIFSQVGLKLGNSVPPRQGQHLFDQDLPPLPLHLINSYTGFMTTLAELAPTGLRTLSQFVLVLLSTITPSVVVSLVVRLAAFFLALRIIPYIRDPSHQRPRWRYNPVMFLIYSYSPCIVIAVYTHLLVQHFGGIVHVAKNTEAAPFSAVFSTWNIWYNSRLSWQFWGWINVFTTLTVYGLELIHGNNDFE